MEDFNQLILNLAAQNNVQQSDYEPDFYDQNDEDVASVDEEDGDDTQQLLLENEELKNKLKAFEEHDNVVDTQNDYYNFMLTQDMEDPEYAINLISSDDLFEGLKGNPASAASWLKKKDSSVNTEGLSSRIINYLDSIPESLRDKLLATSGNDSNVHSKNSQHYGGKALDLRYDKDVYDYIKKDPNFQKSGLKTLNPNHGTAPHIHIEEYMMGGKYAEGGELPPVSVTGRTFKKRPPENTVPSYRYYDGPPQEIHGNPLDIHPNKITTDYQDERILDYDGNVVALRSTASPTSSKVVFTDINGTPDLKRGVYEIPNDKFDRTKKLGIEQLFSVDNFDSYRKK